MEAGRPEAPQHADAAALKCLWMVSNRKGFCTAPCTAPTLHPPKCSQTPTRCQELLRTHGDGQTGAQDHKAHPEQ